MQPQLTLDDEIRKNRDTKQIQLDALRMAQRFLQQPQYKMYVDVVHKIDDITWAIHHGDGLENTVFNVLRFVENFEPIVFNISYPTIADKRYGPMVSELSAAHLAFHGRRDLALMTLGYEVEEQETA